ncbi:CLUMA_CG021477, isoform A [Clunio marinus]|uniref:CLUMA_CG021477, isoform A n=1 Tax=Clunio marinus TaxID=568069 RepID=A0A1J1J884_9DIPT|nr:CLUMA_CG021477, isoform A [Clunio marinus]
MHQQKKNRTFNGSIRFVERHTPTNITSMKHCVGCCLCMQKKKGKERRNSHALTFPGEEVISNSNESFSSTDFIYVGQLSVLKRISQRHLKATEGASCTRKKKLMETKTFPVC